MDIWTATRTILEANPGLQSRDLIEKLRKKTDRGRSTIFEHLSSLAIRGQIHRDKGKYHMPKHWNEHVKSCGSMRYGRPTVKYEVTNERHLPSVGFYFVNSNNYLLRARVKVRMILGGRDLGLVDDIKGYYNGKSEMLFEPNEGYTGGNFTVSDECMKVDEELTLEVRVTVTDPFKKVYLLSPKSWTYARGKKSWFYEPRAFTDES